MMKKHQCYVNLNLTNLLSAVSFQLSGGSESYVDLLMADS